MSYKAVDIKDRVAVGDDCFQFTKLSDGRYKLVPAPDSISEVGTNVDRALLYPMSQELERLSEGLPDVTTADAGKALIVNDEGKYELGEAGAADAVRYSAQTLTDAQKTQTRTNIGAAASDHTQAASTITAGTFAGQVKANATAAASLDTAQVRNIRVGTAEMSDTILQAMGIGDIYYKYEVT